MSCGENKRPAIRNFHITGADDKSEHYMRCEKKIKGKGTRCFTFKITRNGKCMRISSGIYSAIIM
jgi:hypothetical protein